MAMHGGLIVRIWGAGEHLPNKVSFQREYMAIIWDNAWSIGHSKIDKQHQNWIGIFNRFESAFLDAGYHSSNEEYKKDTLNDLLEYTDYHFKTEQDVMTENDYPEAAKHWRLHKDFKNALYEKLREFENEGPVLSSQILSLMKNWLVSHILDEDRKLVLFLKSQ